MDSKTTNGKQKAPGIGLAASPGAHAHVTTRENKRHHQYSIGAPNRKGRVLTMNKTEIPYGEMITETVAQIGATDALKRIYMLAARLYRKEITERLESIDRVNDHEHP